MSFLIPDLQPHLPETSVWYILSQDLTPIEKLCRLSKLDIWGARIGQINYSFSDLVANLDPESQRLARVIYGLFQTCATGEVHELVASQLRLEWVVPVFCLRIHGEPAFPLICQRQMHEVATWMMDWLQRCPNGLQVLNQHLSNGDSALHLAIRQRHWEWTAWLIKAGCHRYEKNQAGESPLLLMAPFEEHVHLLRSPTLAWYNTLHEALGVTSAWTQRLLDEGAALNQPVLYAVPVDILLVLAINGLDMNLSPLPPGLTPSHYRILYTYGRKPQQWKQVLTAFDDPNWVQALYHFFEKGNDEFLTDEYKNNLQTRRCIT